MPRLGGTLPPDVEVIFSQRVLEPGSIEMLRDLIIRLEGERP
jgi:hypothetical protein